MNVYEEKESVPMEGLTPCVLCGTLKKEYVLHVAATNFSSNIKAFDVYSCNTCGLAQMEPLPTQRDIDELYVDHSIFSKEADNPFRNKLFFDFLERVYRDYGDDRRFLVGRCLNMIGEGKSDPKKILDIGCSTGLLMEEFKRRDTTLQVTGIDIDPRAKANAPEDICDHIVVGDFIRTEFEARFDLIVMRALIEHLLAPKSYVEKAWKLLKPHGVLALTTPDFGSAKAKQLGADWHMINDVSQRTGHLTWFNTKTLGYLARNTGFEIYELRNTGQIYHHLSAPLRFAMRYLLGARPEKRFLAKYQFSMLWSIVMDCWLSQKLSYGEVTHAFLHRVEQVGE